MTKSDIQGKMINWFSGWTWCDSNRAETYTNELLQIIQSYILDELINEEWNVACLEDGIEFAKHQDRIEDKVKKDFK